MIANKLQWHVLFGRFCKYLHHWIRIAASTTRWECEEPHQEPSPDQIPTLPLIDFRWTQTLNKALMDGQADVHFSQLIQSSFGQKNPALLYLLDVLFFIAFNHGAPGVHSCFLTPSGNSIKPAAASRPSLIKTFRARHAAAVDINSSAPKTFNALPDHSSAPLAPHQHQDE